VIATGGGPGIMAAANRGAREVGAATIGFNITLPVEQQPNPYTTPELTFRFHYFAMRKMHLAMRANAAEELWQTMTKRGLRAHTPAEAVLQPV
jgi:predicted Rossmann-fold nucleotide-binding protein